ncbi:MAG: serine/threonine-protein kinase [Polyangiaceae bacterium]
MQPEFRADPLISDPLIGAVVAQRFRLARLLGAGGMGRVYAAEPLAGGPRVAMKLLFGDFLSDKTVVDRFLEEGRTCMRLVHPNIVRVLDTGTAEDGTPFIAMELLEGETLGARLSPPGSGTTLRLHVDEATHITQAILAALGAAHSLNVVHRDLKPDNIFLPANSGPNAAKILDFGVAKVVDAAGGAGSRTRTGMLLGTPGYMSPEQIKNSKTVDPRSDLFSAAVLFYEMLTGTSPFPAENEFAKLMVILNEEPRPVDAVNPLLTPLVPFFKRALAKEREARFQSAAEMSAGLANAAGGGRQQLAQTDPMRNQVSIAAMQQATRNSTLASSPHAPVSEAPPQISIVPSPHNGAIPRWIVALLVVGALIAGFVLGLAVAQAQ